MVVNNGQGERDGLNGLVCVSLVRQAMNEGARTARSRGERGAPTRAAPADCRSFLPCLQRRP